MSQIKQLLLLHGQGNKIKYIARTLGISRNTVRSYLTRIQDLKLNTQQLLSIDDPELEHVLSGGNPAYKDDRFEYIRSKLDYYKKQ